MYKRVPFFCLPCRFSFISTDLWVTYESKMTRSDSAASWLTSCYYPPSLSHSSCVLLPIKARHMLEVCLHHFALFHLLFNWFNCSLTQFRLSLYLSTPFFAVLRQFRINYKQKTLANYTKYMHTAAPTNIGQLKLFNQQSMRLCHTLSLWPINLLFK